MRRVALEAGKINLSFIALQGDADQLINPAGTQMLHAKAGSADKTIKTYPGLYHELFNEPERDRVLADVETWLAARV
jgi:alpha-beta hydrolase superfamily lysophospholipase